MTKREPLSVEIYHAIRERILNWTYPPNHHLTEAALQKEFGVSRVPVREALHMLEEHNLVDRVPYQGCRVRQPDLTEVNELYDLRIALELHVVEQLAEKGMEQAQWKELYDTWTRLYDMRELDTAESFSLADYDEQFHKTLVMATGNKTLLAYYDELNERLSFVRRIDITTLARLKATCQQHLPVLEHIRDKNTAAARESMRLNIETGRVNVEAAIKDALVKAFMSNH